MAKYKLSQGQGLEIGPYVVQAASSGVALVAIAVPEPITVLSKMPVPQRRTYVLAPRQSLMIGVRRLVSDSEHAIELELSGPESEVIYVDPNYYPKPARAEQG